MMDKNDFEDPSEIPCDNGFSVEDSVLGVEKQQNPDFREISKVLCKRQGTLF